MGLHTPQRLQGESQAQYRERRQMSRNAVRAVTRGWYGNGQKTSRELQRDDARKNGTLRGTYGAGLLVAQVRRNLQRIANRFL